MESPESWSLLTSSLAVSTLDRRSFTWAFLVTQGLIDPENLPVQAFFSVIEDVKQRGDVTGPSEAARVAGQLETMSVTTKLAKTPDPCATLAESRLRLIRGWLQED